MKGEKENKSHSFVRKVYNNNLIGTKAGHVLDKKKRLNELTGNVRLEAEDSPKLITAVYSHLESLFFVQLVAL